MLLTLLLNFTSMDFFSDTLSERPAMAFCRAFCLSTETKCYFSILLYFSKSSCSFCQFEPWFIVFFCQFKPWFQSPMDKKELYSSDSKKNRITARGVHVRHMKVDDKTVDIQYIVFKSTDCDCLVDRNIC